MPDQTPEDKFQALERYGRDLTEAASQGKLDPVIGRDEEIRRVIVGLDARGILQAVASRNDHDHAWEWVEKLGIAEYIVLPQISWGPKSASVKTIAEKMARHQGIDLTVTATTDRRAGLQDCDAVLTSFRPGGFQARYLDESIPLKHGVIGQETQGPCRFVMASVT